jgi:predicted Zn finger-like uncharacterized protein
MLTQCPSCQTTFRVTSEILRVAHGQVRCGRCQTQFDALERLIEETDTGEIQSGRQRPGRTPAPPPPEEVEPEDIEAEDIESGDVEPQDIESQDVEQEAIEVQEPATHEDITLEGRHIEITGSYRVVDEAGGSRAEVREQVTEEWFEIEHLDEQAAEDEAVSSPVADALSTDDTHDVDALEAEEESSADYEASDGIEVEESQGTAGPARGRAAADAADFDFLPSRQGTAVARIWKLLAAPLAILLLLQLVHTYRYTLARHPILGPPLIGLYGAFGMTLRPDWNLHAYEILQWHVGSDPAAPGTLRVRASIKNLAPFAQPYPLLKLVLEDRWGEQVRSREFEPSEYLDPTTAPDRLLAPAQQANATVVIVDPGPDAEGFRFDVCLRGASGPVCAADVPAAR